MRRKGIKSSNKIDGKEKLIYGIFILLVLVFVFTVVFYSENSYETNKEQDEVIEEPIPEETYNDLSYIEDQSQEQISEQNYSENQIDSILNELNSHSEKIENLEKQVYILRNKVLQLDKDIWNAMK